MKSISTKELNDLFEDTIKRCTYNLVYEEDEIIEYELFEEFEIGVVSFLHENSLDRLLEAGLINKNIKDLSLKLREMYLLLEDNKKNVISVRNDEVWSEILKLSDMIRKEKEIFNKKIYDSL